MPLAVYNYYHADAQAAYDRLWSKLNLEKVLAAVEGDDKTAIFFKYLPKGGKVLDAGCGLGKWVLYLRRHGYDALGVDYSRQAIEMVKAFDPTAPVECGDVGRLPYPDRAFDAYLSIGVLQHYREGPRQALEEAKRIVKDQGLFFLDIPVLTWINGLSYRCLYRPMAWVKANPILRKLLRKRPPPPKLFVGYRYTKREILRLLNDAGLDVVELIPTGHICGFSFSYLEPTDKLLKSILFERQGLLRLLRRISPWVAPGALLAVAKKHGTAPPVP